MSRCLPSFPANKTFMRRRAKAEAPVSCMVVTPEFRAGSVLLCCTNLVTAHMTPALSAFTWDPLASISNPQFSRILVTREELPERVELIWDSRVEEPTARSMAWGLDHRGSRVPISSTLQGLFEKCSGISRHSFSVIRKVYSGKATWSDSPISSET